MSALVINSRRFVNSLSMSKTDSILKMARQAGVLRPRDLDAHKIPRQYLRLAREEGLIKRVGRGLYVAASAQATTHHSLAVATKRLPKGVICLLSALRFHDLTTQAPFEVWIAIDRKARRPSGGQPPLHIVRFSRNSIQHAVGTHKIEGVPVQIFSPAKTVADCFKYRNKIGLDVAIEALRDCLRKRKSTMDDLWDAAKVCRVSRVMQPYLESVR
jgi:predicted transcriptional regulator of viral defense system